MVENLYGGMTVFTHWKSLNVRVQEYDFENDLRQLWANEDSDQPSNLLLKFPQDETVMVQGIESTHKKHSMHCGLNIIDLQIMLKF